MNGGVEAVARGLEHVLLGSALQCWGRSQSFLPCSANRGHRRRVGRQDGAEGISSFPPTRSRASAATMRLALCHNESGPSEPCHDLTRARRLERWGPITPRCTQAGKQSQGLQQVEQGSANRLQEEIACFQKTFFFFGRKWLMLVWKPST